MKNFRQPGKVMTYAHSAAVESGEMIQIGTLVGVAAGKYAANEEGEYSLLGVFKFAKLSTAVFAIGEKVGYDQDTKQMVVDASGDKDFDAGTAFKAAGNGETEMEVLLPLGGY